MATVFKLQLQFTNIIIFNFETIVRAPGQNFLLVLQLFHQKKYHSGQAQNFL